MEEQNKLNFKNIFGIEWRTKYFLHILFVLSLFSIIIFALLLIGSHALTKKPIEVTEIKPDPFQNIALEAKGVVVWDIINQNEIFSKNSNLPLPLASLTKVMTVVTANKNIPDSLSIKIIEEYLEPEGDSNLVIGDTWRAGDLRDFTLLTSSNDGAFALAAIAEKGTEQNLNEDNLTNQEKFMKLMNETANQIGLLNSKFFNEHGLDREADRGGAYGSAKDMATLFEFVLKNHPEILEATRYKNLNFTSTGHTYSADNTNTFIDQIPGAIASKTGFTDLAGGNLVVAFDAGLNRPIIISVLGSTYDGRFEDTLKLVEASLKYIKEN